MTSLEKEYRIFKRSVIISATAHLLLLVFLVLSPHLPGPSRSEMTHYVNIISFGGGGGGSGGGSGGLPGTGGGESEAEEISETPVAPRESLGELTTPQNLQQESLHSLRYPVEKPQREKKSQPEKKQVIRKQEKTAPKTTSDPQKTGSKTGTGQSGSGGSGSGLHMGVGSGEGYGFGSEYASQIGLSTFPYTYYLQQIHSRISNNWFTSRISISGGGKYYTTIKFRIFRSGGISEPEILESSQIRSLDLSALRAVRSAAPFPPLPQDYEDEYLIIRLIFEHGQ